MLNHPSLALVAQGAPRRVVLAGDRLVEAELPVGARSLCPPPPRPSLEPLADACLEAARAALAVHPRARRTTVLVDLEEWTARARAGLRALVAGLARALAAEGASDVTWLAARGLGRKCGGAELTLLVDALPRGARVVVADVEAPASSSDGAADGAAPRALEGLERAERVVLVVAARTPAEPLAEVLARLALTGEARRALLEQAVSGGEGGVVEPDALAEQAARAAAALAARVPASALVALVDEAPVAPAPRWLDVHEDDWSARDRREAGLLVGVGRSAPAALRRAVLGRLRARGAVTAVFGGPLAQVDAAVERAALAHRGVVVRGTSDVVVVGAPHASPLRDDAPLDPLGLAELVTRGLLSACGPRPLAPRGGTLVVLHPVSDSFQAPRQVAARALLHDLLGRGAPTRGVTLADLSPWRQDPSWHAAYRHGAADHPLAAPLAWLAGARARAHFGKVLVVGADNEYVPRWLGWETAASLSAALWVARGGRPGASDVTLLKGPREQLPRVLP